MSLNLNTTARERRSLGDIARASKEKVDPTVGSVDRFVAGEHMDTDDLKVHRWGDVAEVDLGPAFHRRFHPGQVLYGSRRTYLRKVAVADFDGVCANTTFVVETKDENVLLPEFLPFIMISEPFHAFAISESKGSVNPYVNWSDIERFEFDLPPLDEQKRIADLLWAIEHHRGSLIEVESALVDSQEPLMAVDADSFITVSDVVTTARSGATPLRANKDFYGGGIPWLKSGEVTGDDITAAEESISEAGLAGSATWLVPAGAVVVAMYGDGKTRGQVGRLGSPMCTNQAVLALVPDGSKAEPDFLYYWLRSRQAELRGKSAGAAQKNLSKALVVTEPFPNLSRESQVAAARKVVALDQTRGQLSNEASELSRVRDVLIAEIFGGN